MSEWFTVSFSVLKKTDWVKCNRYRPKTYYGVSQKNPPYGLWFSDFFHKQLRIFSQCFTHLIYVPIYMLDYKFLFSYL